MTPAVYTIRSLRANLRAVIAGVRETGLPAVIAERGERPVAVLVDYATWAAQHGGDGAEAMLAPAAGRDPGDVRRDPLPAAERVPPVPAGWGVESTLTRFDTGEQAAIPAGWRVEKSGWGL